MFVFPFKRFKYRTTSLFRRHQEHLHTSALLKFPVAAGSW